MLRCCAGVVPLTDDDDGDNIVTRVDGRRLATPLFAALVMVATFDVVFAIDSIPAIFAITRDTFVVFAANAFSILGLMSLYFLLAGLIQRFRYLNVRAGGDPGVGRREDAHRRRLARADRDVAGGHRTLPHRGDHAVLAA